MQHGVEHGQNRDSVVERCNGNGRARGVDREIVPIHLARLGVLCSLPAPELWEDGSAGEMHLFDAYHAPPCSIDLQHR